MPVAQLVSRSAPRRHRGLVVAAASLLVASVPVALFAAPASADTSPGPTVPGLNCLPEQYPHAGAPRSSAPVPYEIPFQATLGATGPGGVHEGGYLRIANSLVTATLGYPVRTDPGTGETYGTLFARTCGQISLPAQQGRILGNPYGLGGDPNANSDFVFDPNIPVSLSVTGVPGLPLLSAFATDDGAISASIARQPASNGGLQIDFYASAKSTTDFGPALASLATALLPGSGITLPPAVSSLLNGSGVSQATGNTAGASCTVPIGDLRADGVKDLAATGLTTAEATTPVHLTTATSGNLTGRPATGPVTATNAVLVSNDFPVGKIEAGTTPASGSPGAVCTQANADMLNSLLGLPSIPDPATGHFPNTFVAPSTFGVFTSS